MAKCSTDHCHHDALDGSPKCSAHGDEEQRVRRYKFTSKKLQERLDELDQVENPASLRAEVLLAHSALEQRINALGPDPAASDIAGAHGAINDSLRTIEKLVASMHKQDLATNEVLAKHTAFKLVADIVDAISNRLAPFEDHAEYPKLIDNIAEDLQTLVDDASNEE